MFSKEAIEKLSEAQSITAARDAITAALDKKSTAVALPTDFIIKDLEGFMLHRRRARGVMKTSVVADFAAYTESHFENGATIFIEPESMTATGVLNLGSPEVPGHADNFSQLIPNETAAYKALRGISGGNPQSQRAVAEFLEDWIDVIECYSDGVFVPPPKAIAAVRNITIEALRKLDTQEQQLSASKSSFESVQAKSIEPLPTLIKFRCKPYNDLNEREFMMRLGIVTSDKPSLTLRIIKVEEHIEQMADELSGCIRKSIINNDIRIVLGKYTATR